MLIPTPAPSSTSPSKGKNIRRPKTEGDTSSSSVKTDGDITSLKRKTQRLEHKSYPEAVIKIFRK